MKWPKIVIFFPLAFLRLLYIFLLTGIMTAFAYLWLKIFGFSRGIHHFAMKNWGRSILFVCGFKIDRNELPSLSNYILMPNHRSYLDIFIVAGLTPSAMLAKVEVGRWPFLRAAIKITGSIFVNRMDPKSLLRAMGKIKKSVTNGIPVTLFPEGTTYKGPLTRTFKNGSFMIASNTNIPVIPMAIEYRDKNDAWIDDDTFVSHFFRQMGKPITHVTLRYGTPLIDSDNEKLRNATKEQIDNMLAEIHKS